MAIENYMPVTSASWAGIADYLFSLKGIVNLLALGAYPE